ncbi:MAG: sulfur oxidation c-type cytochrome SoxA [Herminiimonas sp.]|nr:sulfur oxidation c-type cytochrome SoxA [Herminiimonas sp.]
MFNRTLAQLLAASVLATSAQAEPDTRLSGFEFMSKPTQAMQRDDTLNPAMLWVKDGETLWNTKAGQRDQSCAACHASAPISMRGVATRYPAFDDQSSRPVNLGQRINMCRRRYQHAAPLPAESHDLLSLESYVAIQSRGLPLQQSSDPRLIPYRASGEQRFMQRIGQLDLSCAQCHDANAGKYLGSAPIPQAHATAYPIYRLEWQGMGSLQRRLRSCMTGVRAQPFALGAQELVELELYLASRANGMPLETPGVRP